MPAVCPLAHLALILARLPPGSRKSPWLRLCASRVPDYVKIRRRNIHSIHGHGPEIVSTPISRAGGTSKLREKPLSQSECHKRPHETYFQIVAGIRVARAEDRSPSLGSRRWSSRGPRGGGSMAEPRRPDLELNVRCCRRR